VWWVWCTGIWVGWGLFCDIFSDVLAVGVGAVGVEVEG